MEERIQILEMLVAGKITIEEADLLLEAITPLASKQSKTQTGEKARLHCDTPSEMTPALSYIERNNT